MRYKIALTLLTACLVSSHGVHAVPAETKSTMPQPELAKPDNRGTAEAPLSPSSKDLEKTADALKVIADHVGSLEKREPENTALEERKIGYEQLTGYGTILLAGITFLLAVATMFLARYTLSLWKATTNLVAGEKESSQRELRAYVKVEFREIKYLRVNGQPEIVVAIANRGKTPAKNIKARAGLWLLPFPMQPDYPFETFELAPRGHGVLFDKDETTFHFRGPLVSQQDADLFSHSQIAFVLVCHVTYEDAFEVQRDTFHVSYCTTGDHSRLGTVAHYAPYGNRFT